MGRLFPRSSLRRIVKKNAKDTNISKRADVLVYLDYILFLEELLKEASIEARQAGDKVLRQRHIERALETTLQKFRG
ncbi:hypothetical protein POJ06DRAFT_256346 [Lipomyces tetrasporus]|uniref:Transcription factor CBF/NF-Y/archaeal histone domain-containing protein n=1 Tax=Lipomyces tetrasporus TaxID=54092 RepID=A0AAD7QQ15_9ASCO|nr:uncharacterized protein POJ06DRAFT_256346 [Lipomyces tetrasporus]KAJ8099213.1 hypothetical protein POJ06DRAFT_256346 [Lipomyces tetrasporus]